MKRLAVLCCAPALDSRGPEVLSYLAEQQRPVLTSVLLSACAGCHQHGRTNSQGSALLRVLLLSRCSPHSTLEPSRSSGCACRVDPSSNLFHFFLTCVRDDPSLPLSIAVSQRGQRHRERESSGGGTGHSWEWWWILAEPSATWAWAAPSSCLIA